MFQLILSSRIRLCETLLLFFSLPFLLHVALFFLLFSRIVLPVSIVPIPPYTYIGSTKCVCVCVNISHFDRHMAIESLVRRNEQTIPIFVLSIFRTEKNTQHDQKFSIEAYPM